MITGVCQSDVVGFREYFNEADLATFQSHFSLANHPIDKVKMPRDHVSDADYRWLVSTRTVDLVSRLSSTFRSDIVIIVTDTALWPLPRHRSNPHLIVHYRCWPWN